LWESAPSLCSCRARRSCRFLFITQAINAVLLLPLLAFIALLTRDRSLMGEYATGRAWTVLIVAVTLMIAAATIVLGVVLVGG
jgi:Mn2+/Fe2+ NRAMP family transporter